MEGDGEVLHVGNWILVQRPIVTTGSPVIRGCSGEDQLLDDGLMIPNSNMYSLCATS